MKRITLVALMILIGLSASAQRIYPEPYLSNLPSIPGNVCGDDTVARNRFHKMIDEAADTLSDVINRNNKATEEHLAKNEDAMARHALEQTGMKPEDIQKMMAIAQSQKGAGQAQKKQSKEEMKQAVDQMMQNSYNISMEEIDNLKKMDTTARKAWATGYATEKKAEVMADPEAAQEKQKIQMELYEVTAEHKRLLDSLKAPQDKVFRQCWELDTNEQALSIRIEIDSLAQDITEMYNKPEPSIDAIKSTLDQIRQLKHAYCNMQSTKFLRILDEYRIFTINSLNAFDRLQDLHGQILTAQTGTDPQLTPGLFALQQVQSYVNLLSKAYQYNIIDGSEKFHDEGEDGGTSF